MASKPIVLPDLFNGEGSWTEWSTILGTSPKWTSGTTCRNFSGCGSSSFFDTVKALNERFEPQSRQTRYQAEFKTRRKRAEGWVEFVNDLKMLADKGFPNLSKEAKKQLALQTYIQQLEQPQITFGVKQRLPKTLDEAVTATIEMETYLPGRPECQWRCASRRTNQQNWPLSRQSPIPQRSSPVWLSDLSSKWRSLSSKSHLTSAEWH